MDKTRKEQTSKYEKIVLVAVIIVVSLGVTYMAYDYVTTMEQLDDLKNDMIGNSSFTKDSNTDSVLDDPDK